jgi:DNA-binding transcriptional ArsR family regulator
VQTADIAKALSSEPRLAVLQWLKSPRAHFPKQVAGDLVDDGVCSLFIARKLGVSEATAHQHLKVLSGLGLIRPKKIKQWTFYKRDEKKIAQARKVLRDAL